jgi:hypothetical protein
VRQVGLAAGAGWANWLPPGMVPPYRAWVRRTYGPLARKVGFAPKKGETDDDKSMRLQILSRMSGDGDDPGIQAEARRRVWKWLADRQAVPADMIDTLLAIAARRGDRRLYERVLARAREAHAAGDKLLRERCLGALAGFEDPALAARTRHMMLEDEFPTLETAPLLYAGTDSRAGQVAAWEFLVENYEPIHVRTPREERAALIELGGDCTEAGLGRTVAFFAERTPKELMGPRTFRQFVENQKLCIARREKDAPSFVEFLRSTTRAPRASLPR